ncbi:MAG: tRNA glutamyl-Q(34) synthetase GluQRS [Robiginitomaculum sp.]|nr:tRNA glutamyl-Q(34) synthetase GluQRS [Robiginitomaculum sp.]
METVITRFAPSPTGYLHLGHAASAAQAFAFPAKHGGTCLLRIEDIDTTRCKPEYEQAIYEDLSWLGFSWPTPVRRQSDHFADYDKVLQNLRTQDLVYRCFKTRKEVLDDIARAPHEHGVAFIGASLPKAQETDLLGQEKPYAWRLSLEMCREILGKKFQNLYFSNNGKKTKARPDMLGDVILARKDVGTSYHIACCHDDAVQGVTDIIRGVDLLETTTIHRLLQEIMGWPVPHYQHHELLVDANGKRFAKRDQAKTLRAMRQSGAEPENILALCGPLG